MEPTDISPPPPAETRHSYLGIASFVLSILTGLAIIGLIGVAGYMEQTTEGGLHEESPQAVIIGLALIALVFICLLSLGLGVGSFFEKGRKKVFGVIGVVIAALTVVFSILLVAVGIMMG